MGGWEGYEGFVRETGTDYADGGVSADEVLEVGEGLGFVDLGTVGQGLDSGPVVADGGVGNGGFCKNEIGGWSGGWG